MREIEFRGKRVDNGEWVYGYYVKCLRADEEQYYIYTGFWQTYGNDYYSVIPGTIMQYTGLKDNTGKKIFEGDIVDFLENTTEHYKIVFWKGAFCAEALDNKDEHFRWQTSSTLQGKAWTIRIIGNVYENPELLGGE